MKKVVRLTESDLARLVKRVIKEGGGSDLGLPHPNKTVYKELFERKLSEVMSEVGTDSEAIYDFLIGKLDDIMEEYRYGKSEDGKYTWSDDEL